ncbi:MAG: hypothetical protein OSJ66_03365 [Clostridia bacterium]|nr:hypothetical protein [Clostridia bacterium]
MKYDAPNEVSVFNNKKCIKNPKAIPKNPAKYPSTIYINLKILIEKAKVKSGIVKLQIPVKAIIIIRIGLTILAETAASP